MDVGIKPITKENIMAVIKLKVAEDQKEFIMPNATALALCYVQNDSVPLAVEFEDEIVGLIMYEKEEAEELYDIQIMMIDEKYQGNGIGKEAFKKLLQHLKGKEDCNRIALNFVPSNERAGKFYRSFGFEPNGEMFNNEIVMEMKIKR